MNYALIENGIVTNIIILLPYNIHDFPNAVCIENISVQIGDTYDGAHFYHNGKLIYGTQEQLSDAQTALGLLGYTEEETTNG